MVIEINPIRQDVLFIGSPIFAELVPDEIVIRRIPRAIEQAGLYAPGIKALVQVTAVVHIKKISADSTNAASSIYLNSVFSAQE